MLIRILKVLFFSSLFLSVSGFAYSSDAFVIKVKTDNSGDSNSTQFIIPINPNYTTYDYHVDCDNDGVYEVMNHDRNYTCNYSSAGEKTVVIRAIFPAIYFNYEGDSFKIISIEQWGTGNWRSMSRAFYGTPNLLGNTTDKPELYDVTDLTSMFDSALSFNQNINDWDVSRVTNMSEMFERTDTFNQDIGDWNVSSVIDMGFMFNQAKSFNQDIGDWDVSQVTNMSAMFAFLDAFNQDLSDWNVSKVTTMYRMFSGTKLSVSNYDNLLINWNKLNLKPNVVFDAGDSSYCDGESARASLISNFGWTINDSGIKDCTFHITSPNEISVISGEKVVTKVSADTDEGYVYGLSNQIADGDKFEINAATGKLSFKIAPDVENPLDKNGDNVYRVQVFITNLSAKSDWQTIKVKVVPNNKAALVSTIMYLLN